MAEDFLLNESDNKPNPGPVPFSYQSIFDAFKNKDTKSLQVYDDKIKNLREVKTPDELGEVLANKESQINFFSQNRDKLQNFGIFNPEDFGKKASGELTDFDKINIADASGRLKSTPIPNFGEPGYGTFIKNQKHYQFKEQDAIDVFSQMAASGLNVKHTGEEILDYNSARQYFSDPTNVDNWQKQKSTQDKLSASKLNVFSILERLQPKETIPAAEMEVAQAVVRDRFFGKLEDAQIGQLLDEGGEIAFDEFSGLYQDIDEQDFLQRIGQETLSASGESLGINEVSIVNKKEDVLNKQSLDRYLTSLGMNPEEIMSFKIDKIEKYRHQKFLNQDLQNNISSAEGLPVDIFQADQNQTSLANRQATFYAFGSQNEYQQRMDMRGYNMLSEQDQKVHTKRLEMDRLRRELKWYENGNPADYRSAEERLKKAEGDLQASLKETGEYSGFTIYDPETRQPFAQEVIAGVSNQVNQKYNKEYYAKTSLGKMKRERNALFLDTETLKNELGQSLNPDSEDYQIKKRLYLQKSVELYTLNRALYTNDNPMKRMGNALQQFLDGVKEAAAPDVNISRLDETLAMYNNLSKYGIVLEDKDIEEVQNNLDYTMMETLGSGTYETTKILLETIAYSYMGMGALNAATRLKQYTRLKEGMGALYGQRGTALVNHFEKLVEFSVKGGAQIAAGQTTAGYVTEEAAEGAVDYVANTFKKLYSNKVSAFLTKFVAGTVGSSIGEFFGNMSDSLLENGFDVREAFKETYGEDWETQEKQLAVLGLMSMGFAGASNVGLLIKTKESFAYWKQQLGGKFTDPLMVEVERIVDEAIENYKPSTVTQQQQVQNIQSENPETLPVTDAVEMSSEPIEPPEGGVSEPTESRVLEPVPTDRAAEVKQAEKLEVEKRVAERGEVFHVVEADGSVNKEVEYRYNETTGKIESRGYTAFNNSFEEVNEELARTIEAKVNDSGMLSKTKATEIASQTLGLDKADRLVEIDGQVYLSRDPKAIKEESDKKITNVNTVAKNTFSTKIKELRNKVKDALFSDVETQFTPEFNDFYNKLKTSVGLRLNRTSLLFKDAAYLVESSYKGLPKVADYLGSISKSFGSTKAGLDLFTDFTNKILTSKRFQNSDLSKDANASDYAKNIALQMLLNEDPSIAEYFDNDKEAINSFNRFRVGFVRHAAKNFTSGTVKYNASFFNQNVNPKVDKRTEQDLDRTERDQLLVREQRRGIKRIFDMAGEGDRLDLSNDENLKTVDAIRYSKGELSAEDFLNSIGESFEGMSPQEVSQLAEQKQNELADINKFEAWSQKLADFAKTEGQVKKKLRKELNKTFNYISPESSLEEGSGIFNRAYVSVKKAVEGRVNIGKRKRQKNRQVADVMYEMLQTMALRSNSTPEQMLEEQINFQKASEEQAREIIQKAYDSGELDVLFDFYAGGAGASYSKEIYSNLKKAEELLTNGADPQRVLLMYGALYGPDGQMRIKLAPQFKFKNTEALNKIYKAQSIGRVVELSSLVDFPELFELYPDLKKLKVEFAKPEDGVGGTFIKNPTYSTQADIVRADQTFDENIFDIGVFPGTIVLSTDLNANQLIGVLKHEIQHVVQSLEGMSPGSTTEDTRYFVFTRAQAKSFIDEYTLGRIAEQQASSGFDGYLSESQKIYEQELLELGELMNEVSELLSEMGGDTAVGSRGSLFLFANLLRTAMNTKRMGEDILPAITEKIKSYLPLGDTTQEIEQNTKNIAKLSEIVNNILTGPGSIKQMELGSMIESLSSFNLYQNNLGEMEARAVENTHFDFYNFHNTLEKTIQNAFKQKIPFNRKMAKYLSDRANLKRIELAEEIRQTGAEFISSMPSSDIELMKLVDELLHGDVNFDLNQNPDFKAFRFNVQRLTQELGDSYTDAVNFLKSEGVSVLSAADINFGNNITNALVEKILNPTGDKAQIFKGNQKTPSFLRGGAEDPTAVGEPPISNKAIEAQIRLEDELYGIEAPVESQESGSMLPPETLPEKRIRIAETKLFKTLKAKLNSLYPEIELDFINENNPRVWAEADDNIFNQLSKKKKEEYKKSLEKRRPDLVADGLIDSVLDEIAKFGEENSENGMGNPKLEKLAMFWIARGNVILPEDGYKIVEAERVASIKKVDPFTFNDPTSLINKYLGEVKEKRIDPDTVPEFKDKIEHSEYGVTIYTVDDTKEGQAAVRKAIDTHFGKDANPWCLAARIDDTLDNAWYFWSQRYTAYPKQIAFKDGKLIAFSANSNLTETWWDRNDSSSPGVEVNIPLSTMEINIINSGSINLDGLMVQGRVGKDGLTTQTKTPTSATKKVSTGSGTELETRYELIEDWRNVVVGETKPFRLSLEKESSYKNGKLEGTSKSYSIFDGRILKETGYKNGQLDGKSIEYYDTGRPGRIISEENYEAGIPVGTFRSYWSDGSLRTEGNWKDGRLDGRNIRYYENGQLKEEANFKNGKREGKFLAYFENGQLREKASYDNDLLTGEFVLYNENGSINELKNYKEGEEHGVQKDYYSNGQLHSELNYTDGYLYGDQTYYYDDGNVFREESRSRGLLVGSQRRFHTNGQLYIQENYNESGKQSGSQVIYFENGQVKTEEYYKDGYMFGPQIYYYENGQMASKYGWDNGRDGEFLRFYDNGQPELKAYYENGKLSGRRTTYYLDGTVEADAFFIDDYPTKSKVFYPDGKLMAEFDQVTREITKYDRQGNEVSYTEWELSNDRDRYDNDQLRGFIFYQKQDGKIIGQANLKEMTVLIDAVEQAADTLPHEYAHHYVGWFRETPLVKEAIRKYGSEEALVQAIGEEVVKRNGEAWTWFKRFTEWVKSFFTDISALEKEQMVDSLTNSFLTAKDLETKKTGISAERSRELAKRATEPRNGDTLFQNEGGTVRGAVVFDDTQATIYAMTDPTVATPLHELAHVYEKYLTPQERQEVLNASGKDTWDRSVSEYFARGFEKYLADGVSPGTKLVTAFRKFKVWMSSIFNTFEQPDVELNEDMRRIYSVMLGETPLSDVPGAEISSEVSDTNQVKDELGDTIESMRKAGNTDQEIYQGLISEGLFSAADISEYFDLNTKQTVYDQVQNSGKFAEEARDILEDSQHVIRSLAELKKEMANISEEEARGILYSLNSLPDIDVSVAKLISAMLENQGKGIRSVEDFMLIAKTGTNVGRALQRFKMLKKQQPKLILASLIKDLNAVGAKIPTNALRVLDEAASRLVDATENLEIAKQANQDARFVNSTSPFDPNKSNHEYFNDAMIEFQKAKLDYSRKMQPWARMSVNKGAGKAFAEWYKTSVRLNLLTFRSLGRNVSSNIVKGALNTAVNKIATATSIIRSIILGGNQTTFKGVGYNLATAKGVAPGLKQTGQVLRYGNVTDIGKKIEINGGFNGFRAAAEWIGAAFAKLSGASDIEIAERFNFVLGPDNKIKNGDKFLRFTEGSLGVFSETIGRLMQAGDLVFKNTAYYGAMHQEAKRRGLKGKEIKHFMDLHADYSDANSFEDALTFVYANDSKAYKAVSRMFSGGGSNFYSSLWATLVPYQKIPTNVFAEYFEFMTPLYGLASAGFKFNDAAGLRKQLKKERNANKKAIIQEKMDRINQKAEQSIGRAVTGFGLYMIAFELVKLGVLSAKSQSRKEREEKDEYGGDNRINLTLLLEQLNLIPKTTRDKQEWADGDVTMELEFLGAMGAIFALSQAKFENIKKDVYNKPLDAESKKLNEELEPNMNIVDIIDPTDLSNVFGPLGYNLNLSFVKNLGSATEAILDLSNADSEDPGKMAKFLVDLTMTSISSVLPNIMTDLTKLTEGEDGVKFDYNIKELDGGAKITRDLGARLNERLFRVFTDKGWMDADTDRDVFNQAKKLTPTGRSPLAYQMFDLTRTNLEKGLSTRHNQFMNQAKKPSWQDLVAIARLYNAPESVFPGLPKPIKETSIGAIKLNPTLGEIREHKATVLKIREQVVNSVIDEMYNNGDLRTFFDMTEEINQKKQYQVSFGIRAFSKIMSSVYSKSESIVNKYSIPLIEVNYIGRLKQDNPKAYAKYQKMVSENIYGTFYDKIENDPEYKAELEEFKLKVLNDIKDVISNQSEVSLDPFE
jgi:antitoxin component YwqK of YwqJK toxin-antitoxin module